MTVEIVVDLMMFFLKKAISQFLMPMPFIVLLFILGLICVRFCREKRIGRCVISVAALLFLLFGYGVGMENYLYRLERLYPSVELNDMGWESLNGSAIIVLGCGMPKESDLNIRYRTGAGFQMRLQEGVRLYRKIPNSMMIVSIAGDADVKTKESFLDDYAQEHKLNRKSVFLVPSARDTSDEARLSIDMISPNKLVIVTSATHIPRAVKIFAKELKNQNILYEMNPIVKDECCLKDEQERVSLLPAPCDFLITAPTERRFELWALPFPSLDGFNLSHRAIYEFLGNLYEDMRK